MQVLSIKKRSSEKNFRRYPEKNAFQKLFQPLHKLLTAQKIVLSSSRGRAIFEDLRPRGQGQGHQNVFSRTPPLIAVVATKNESFSTTRFIPIGAAFRGELGFQRVRCNFKSEGQSFLLLNLQDFQYSFLLPLLSNALCWQLS